MSIYYKGKYYKSINDLWHSEEGYKFKQKIIKKRGRKCEITGLNYNNVEFHHKKPKSLYPELIFDEDNVIIILTPLHQLFHYEFPILEEHNEELTQLFANNYKAGKYGKIDLTAKRNYIIKKDFTVIKKGFTSNNKQRYAICDKNKMPIIWTIRKDKIEVLCKVLNIFFYYSKDTATNIKKWIENTFNPYYETFCRMISMS